MGSKMLKEILHSQEPKILYHHKNPTLDTIHMQLNLLIFSPWPFKFYAPTAVREMFSLKCPLLYNRFPSGWKGSTLLGQQCLVCLLNAKITVFHDAMSCSPVKQVPWFGRSLLPSSAGYGTTASKMLVHTYYTLIYPPDDRWWGFIRNNLTYLPNYKVSHARKRSSSSQTTIILMPITTWT